MLKQNQPSSSPVLAEPGTIAVADQGGHIAVTLSGRWDVRTCMLHERELISLATIEPVQGRTGLIDISAVTLLDTVGAIAVARIRDRLARSGEAEVKGAHDAQVALLDQVAHADARPLQTLSPPTLVDRIAALGAWAFRIGRDIRELVGFFGELTVVFARIVRHPRRLRLTSTVHHMQAVGIDAMPIVGLLAFLVGVVLTFISGDQLKRFGAGIFIVNLLGIGVLREMGILITAIIVAGRSGSAFTAEIGTMKINQEVDAMRTFGLDPMEVLVVPRALGLMLMLIPLGFFADVIMISGGALMSELTLGVTIPQFITQFRSAVAIQHLWVGVIKAPFFALAISMVGCYHGLLVAGSAESVGQHTTQSVVQSIFLVIALDAIFAVVFSQLGW